MATNVSESLEIMRQWVACAVIFFVFFNMVKTTTDITIILITILSSFTILLIIGLLQFFDPTFNSYYQAAIPAGTFGNKNMFCDYIIIVCPICFYFFFNGHDNSKLLTRIIAGILLITSLLIIIFAKTRSEMIAFPILTLILLVAIKLLKVKNVTAKELYSKQKVRLIIALLCLFLTLISSYLLFSKKESQAQNLSKLVKSIFIRPNLDENKLVKIEGDAEVKELSDSGAVRLITWANTLKMIQDKPVTGFGLYNWQIHYGEYRNAYYTDPTYTIGSAQFQTHNDYLQILADLGLVGFLLFAWLVITLIVIFFKIYLSPEDDLDFKLKSLSLILCIIGFGMACFFSFLVDRAVPTFLFAIYAALLSNLYYYSKGKSSKTHNYFTLNYKIAGWLSLLVLLISIFIVSLQQKRSESDRYFKKALEAYSHKNFDVVIESCKQSLAANKFKYKNHILSANANYNLGNFLDAEKQIEKGLEYYPNDLKALIQAGTFFDAHFQSLLKTANPDTKEITRLQNSALKYFNRALKIRPDAAKVLQRQMGLSVDN